MRILVRGQTQLMGFAIDQCRASLSSDRQFKQVEKLLKGREQSLRTLLLNGLVEAGFIEQLSPADIAQMK
jgi:hypothetical protein